MARGARPRAWVNESTELGVQRFRAFECRAQRRLGYESVLHVDAGTILVHPAGVGFGVMLVNQATSATQFTERANPRR